MYVMVLAAASSLAPPPVHSSIPTILDSLEKLFTIIGILAAGTWTYFNFFKGRTYRLRLEPKIFGQFFSNNGRNYLISTIQLKNVGLSKIKIQQKGSGLRILSFRGVEHATDVKNADWQDVKTFSIFEDQQWIEPGETVEEQKLFSMPESKYEAFQLVMRMPSGGIVWMAKAIVRCDASSTQAAKTNNPVC